MLEKIHNPSDIQNLNTEELKCLAGEIREFLTEHISRTGGHLAANLGVVELTLALFLEFDPYKDRIIWDVGHQAYVHKILTNRADKFDTLRKQGGLSGFPKFSESTADAFNSGHSSTSVSAAAGFAAAAALNGTSERAVAVIGDGAMTGGMAYEALNHAGSARLPIIVVLNDNGMSISKNVGGISKQLKRIRVTAKYLRLKSNVKSTLDRIPIIGAPLKKFVQGVKNRARAILLPSVIFEDFGFKYMGPVDGHNISDMREVFERAKEQNEPVLVHVYTKKGKGYAPAEKNPDYFHGISSFDEKTGIESKPHAETWSDFFGTYLCAMASENKKITAVTAAMPLGTGLTEFASKYPDRFFDVAIAEQHAVTFCAAMAKGGLAPVAAIYSTFLQRAYDQILHDVSLMNQHVVFCIDRCGPVGSDGETHQGVFDIAYMYQMPNMQILSPSDKTDFASMLDWAVNRAAHPVAVRYPRGEIIDRAGTGLGDIENVNKSRLVKDGKDILIAAVGITLYDALIAAYILEKRGISAAVADVRCVRPIDSDFMRKGAADKRAVVSIEDGIVTGGFGQQLEDVLGVQILKFGYPTEPIEQGSVEQIKIRYGLDSESIADRVEKYLTK